MLKIWKQTGNKINHTTILEKNCWLQVTTPTHDEIESLQQEYGIALDHIMDIQDADERSRYEKEDDYTLIIFRMPVYSPTAEYPYSTIPIGIILLGNLIITISSREIDFIHELVENRVRGFTVVDQTGFVLYFFQRAAIWYLKYLKEINKTTTIIERELQRSVKNTELVNLLEIEKSLVYFTTSLRSNELMIEKLTRIHFKNLPETYADILEDVVNENKQAMETTNIYSNILSGMMDAFASVISNNLNIVMKRLTMVSIIIMIPTFFASIYGMNVPLPFMENPFAWLGIIGISAFSSLVAALFFLRTNNIRTKMNKRHIPKRINGNGNGNGNGS
ncbi:MAG: magnesium transporter CorA family protein [Spirochaetales bacterium]|nr:magnesium transporter CorA family protein [Spirochaetales bacterium]